MQVTPGCMFLRLGVLLSTWALIRAHDCGSTTSAGGAARQRHIVASASLVITLTFLSHSTILQNFHHVYAGGRDLDAGEWKCWCRQWMGGRQDARVFSSLHVTEAKGLFFSSSPVIEGWSYWFTFHHRIRLRLRKTSNRSWKNEIDGSDELEKQMIDDEV